MINITVINNDGVQTNYQVNKLEIHQPVPNFWVINLPEQQVEIPLDSTIISSVDMLNEL